MHVMVVHALYYLAAAMGWRSGLRWQLLDGGVYSPDLARLIAVGRPPRPPSWAVERLRSLVETLCGDDGGADCGAALVAAAKLHAASRLGLPARMVAPLARGRSLQRLVQALEALEEKPITPTPPRSR